MLQRLFPLPAETAPLRGLYLELPLRPEGWTGLFCYSNFVTSLDGRIAVPAPTGQPEVPEDIANPRDWRLFQELSARADVLITSGRYLRDYAAGQAQSPLPVSVKEEFTDLRQWRLDQGLAAQPDVAVISASLDFNVPAGLVRQGRRILVFTTADPDPERADRLRQQGAEVVATDATASVPGEEVIRLLETRGYRNAYCVAGPYVLRTLLAAGALHTLFLTTVTRMLGGDPYTSMVHGPLLTPAADYRLVWLYLDPDAPDNVMQMFARYDLPAANLQPTP